MESEIESSEKFPCIVRAQFEKLGTDINIQIVVFDVSQKEKTSSDLVEIEKLYFEFTKIFSRFDGESELSRLNDLLGEFNPASPCMREVVIRSLEYNRKTDGLFDPRILDILEKSGYADDFKKGVRKLGGDLEKQANFSNRDLADDLKVSGNSVFFGVRMDFSGIAKGYITDQVAKFLLGRNWGNFLVDSGGDIFIQGTDESGQSWTVSVEGIAENKLVFALDKKGIATSGISRRKWEIDGKRMHHIINPKKPQHFSFDLKSVTVIAGSTTEADVWAKTIFMMGKESAILYAKRHDMPTVVIDSRGNAWISSRAKEFML